jgi:membrane protein
MSRPSRPPSLRDAKARPALKDAWPILKETATEWSDDNASRLAASLACYTLLSIAPLVVLSVSVMGFLLGEEAARGHISQELGNIVGAQAAGAVEAVVLNAQAPTAGVISSIVGVAVLLFGASGVFGELQASLNTIWEVQPKPNQGIKGFIRTRFFSFAMVLSVAFLLLVSLVISAGVSVTGRFFENYLPGGEALWQAVNLLIALGVTTALFALIYRVIPDVKIAWRDVWVGAFVTALLFSIGKALLALYIGKSSTASSFGVAGSLVALVLWVYYSSQIVFLGAEFTQVWARRYGGRIVPSDHAVPLTVGAKGSASGTESGEPATKSGLAG